MADLLEAIKAHVHLDAHITPPVWIGTDQRDDVVPLENGLLNIGTCELIPHTPDFSSPHVLPFGYDPDAPYPWRWMNRRSNL